MSPNILITGAAGYIGGSIIAEILSRQDGPVKTTKLYAAARSQEQVQTLSKLGVGALQLDLGDASSVKDAVLANEIDIIIHTAGSTDSSMVLNLIHALGQRRQASGRETFFIHTSVLTMFSDIGGWVYGRVQDTDSILEKEKEIGGPNPVRLNNILVAEEGKTHGVTTMNVAVPLVYGRGTGEWRKLSVNIPAHIRAAIKLKAVYKFDVDNVSNFGVEDLQMDLSPPTLHMSDLATLYVLIVEKILQGESVPSGEKGYYFAMAHRAPWTKAMEGIAKSLYARGLVTEPEVKIWSSDDMASEELQFPKLYIRPMCTSTGDIVPVNAYKLGWKPEWDEQRFLDSLDDEVQAVLDLDTVKMTLFDTLMSNKAD